MDILILHGWNVSHSKYDPIARLLQKKGHRVVVPDMPGFGNTPIPKKPWDLSDYALFAKEVITQYHLKNPRVIGHSFGGRVAIILADQYPKLIGQLVLTGVPGVPPVPNDTISFYMMLAKIGRILFSLPLLKYLKDFARKCLYRIAGGMDYYRTEGVMRTTFTTIIREDLIEPMKRLSLPVALIWGAEDTITPIWIARRMHEIIKNSSLTTIENGLHCVIYDKPKDFMHALNNSI